MATAGYEGNAGTGGKFRKRPFRKNQNTPYDRPPTALRPTQAERTGWLSKLVDPASKLITSGAHKLFSSVFRKRLLPPPQHPPDQNKEARDTQPETISVVPSGTKDPVVCREKSQTSTPGCDMVAELEDILKQKTFTRSEIDHLTALLLSRTVDRSAGGEKGRYKPEFSNMQASHDGNGKLINFPNTLPATTPTPTMRSKVLEDDCASPAELAKEYMGSSSTRVSPSVLTLQNQTPRDELSSPYNLLSRPRSPTRSLLQKPASDIGSSENRLVTPRFRGRSAIYSMARTPNSRVFPNSGYKAAGNSFDACGLSSSFHDAAENNQVVGSKKQVLKRRSSVLENDIGSVGPICRIRHKPNLLHPKTLSLPASGGLHAMHGSGSLTDVAEVPFSLDPSSRSHSLSKSLADNSMPSSSGGYVPSQSIEMAQKIFQQLDKITPKGKSPKMKIDSTGGNPSTTLTPLLHGSARRSMEAVDSLKVLQNFQGNRTENGTVGSVLFDAHDHLSKIPTIVEETSLKKLVVPSDDVAPQRSGEANSPTSDSLHITKVTNHVVSQSVVDHPPIKRAFQMSAHDDYLEMDDNAHLNGVASTPSSERGEGVELPKESVVLNSCPHKEATAIMKPPVPERKPATTILNGKELECLSDSPAAVEKRTGSTFPVLPSSSPASGIGVEAAVGAPQSTSEFDKVSSRSELNDNAFGFGSKSYKWPPVSFSASSSVVGSAGPSDSKLELPSSANDAAAKANGPDRTDNKRNQDVTDVLRRTEDAPSPVINSAKGVFGSPTNSVDNGLYSSVPPTSTTSSMVLFSSSSNQSSVPLTFSASSLHPFSTTSSSLSNGFVGSTSTSTISAAAGTMVGAVSVSSTSPFSASSSSHLSNSVMAPSVSSGPSIQFGSSAVSSLTSASLPASASDSAANLGRKTNERVSGAASGGEGNFGFNASTSKPAGNDSHTTAPAGSTSIFGLQASCSPSLFGSSASSPVFGLSGATSPSSGASVFGSLTPAANPFGSGSASKTTTPSTTFGTTSPSSGFSFGTTVAGSLTAGGNTSMVFGSTSGASAASNSAPFVFGLTALSPVPVFSFPSAASSSAFSPCQPAFGNISSQAFAFGSAPAGNNDQMSMEDSMAEDAIHPSTPVFGQSPVSAPSSGFVFGAAVPTTGGAFQFGSQQNQMAPHSPSPFEASSSLEFNAGGAGSFSLGAGGGDKSNRRIVKVKGKLRRK